MPTVKGSRQEKKIVVVHRPWRSFLVRFGVVALIAAAGGAGFFYGNYRALNENATARVERDQLRLELENSVSRIDYLERELADLEQNSEIDRQALADVQDTLVNLRRENATLEEEVLFYRQIMSPENGRTGLEIGQFELRRDGDTGRIAYLLQLQQLGTNDQYIRGYTNVDILGRQHGEEVTLPLHRLSEDQAQEDIRIEFRYFQNIDGEMILPEGFEPESVRVVVMEEGEDEETVERTFSWLVQE